MTTIPPKKVSGPASRATTARAAVSRATVAVARPAEKVVSTAARLVHDAAADVETEAMALADDAGKTADILRESAADAVDRTQAMLKTSELMMSGLQELQETVWTSMSRMFQTTSSMPAELAHCTSFTELAEKQRDLMQRGFTEWLDASHQILMAARSVSDRAFRPFELPAAAR